MSEKKEYIDRKNAIEIIESHMTRVVHAANVGTNAAQVYIMAKNHAIDYLRVVPAADVQEVKHGYWEDDEYMYICNICGKWLDITQGTADMNYCPNCGAKMGGGK